MSIFVRFKQGTRIDVEADIFESLRTILKETNGKPDVPGALRTLIKLEFWDQPRPDANSTWFGLAYQFLQLGRHFKDEQASRFQSAQLNLLRSIVEGGTPEELWYRVKPIVLHEIDFLSGWQFSIAKHSADLLQVHREADGTYYTVESGERFRVLGARTKAETKLEYLGNEAFRKYGYIHQVCRLISLCNIFLDFKADKTKYPESIRVFLPEDHYLNYSWHWLTSVRSPRIPWRPPLRYCEPDFLASDLMGTYVDQNPLPDLPAVSPEEIPEDQHSWQYEVCLDTDLRIGTEEETIVHFQGRQLRWINGSREYCPIVVLGTEGKTDFSSEARLVNEFLSILCFETDVAIIAIPAAAGSKRRLPYSRNPRKLADMVYPAGIEVALPKPMSESRQLALALYREGISSKSIYYEFLTLYKILEIPFLNMGRTKRDAAVIGWINNTAKGDNRLFTNRVQELQASGRTNIGRYLRNQWRHAIVHTKGSSVLMDPDEQETRQMLSKDLSIVKGLARLMIESNLLD